MRYERIVDLDRATGIDLETGRFPAVLYSDGEASDGHILSIPGMRVPNRMPMFTNHFPDPTEQLGSILDPEKRTQGAPGTHVIRITGHIEVGGDGPMADIRRDVAYMMSQNHVSRMSGRWDAEERDVVRRTELPESHFAHVSASETGRRRFGLFFKRSRGLEGSIVGLGADPKAVAGRAQDEKLASHVREFWRTWRDASDEEGNTKLRTIFDNMRVAYREARASGASFADVLNAMDLDPDEAGAARELDRYEIAEGVRLWLPVSVGTRLAERERAFGEAVAQIRNADNTNSGTRTDDDWFDDLEDLGEDPHRAGPDPDNNAGDAQRVDPPPPATEGRTRAKPGTIGAMDSREFSDMLATTLRSAVEAGVRRATGRLS